MSWIESGLQIQESTAKPTQLVRVRFESGCPSALLKFWVFPCRAPGFICGRMKPSTTVRVCKIEEEERCLCVRGVPRRCRRVRGVDRVGPGRQWVPPGRRLIITAPGILDTFETDEEVGVYQSDLL